jgi:general secretion pathway protein I
MSAQKQHGLTLLEVLVALVILTIALTAVIKATTENIRGTSYLQEKTLGTWVGLNILNQARLNLIQFPEAPEYRDGNDVNLGQAWDWKGQVKTTPNPKIREVHVKVFHPQDHHLITELMSYIYVV